MLRLRPPAVLKVSLRNAYPRCYVTRASLSMTPAHPLPRLLWPFSSRALPYGLPKNLRSSQPDQRLIFKVRRCQIKIRRILPSPGCMYSNENVPAPCFAGCTKEDYDVEVQRRWCSSWTPAAAPCAIRSSWNARAASEQLDFERGVYIKKSRSSTTLRGFP